MEQTINDEIDDLDILELTDARNKKQRAKIPNLKTGKSKNIVDILFDRTNMTIKRIRKRLLKVSIFNTILGIGILTGSVLFNLPVLYSFFGFSLLVMSINGLIIGVK